MGEGAEGEGRKRLEQEKKAQDEAAKRQQAIEDAQRIRRMVESAAALAVSLYSISTITCSVLSSILKAGETPM